MAAGEKPRRKHRRTRALRDDPAQLRLDVPVYADPVWRGLSDLMSRAPRSDGRGWESLAEEYRTGERNLSSS